MMKRLMTASLALLAIVVTLGSADARPRRAVQAPVCDNFDIFRPCPQASSFPTTRAERRAVRAVKLEQSMPFGSAVGDSGLLDKARAYLGTNPTGWRRLWCARFIAVIAPHIAAKVRNPNMAKAYLPLAGGGCRPGALVVTSRRGGGHIGVVESCNGGNPVTISGNHGRTVGRGTYSAGRVLGYING